MNNFSFNPGIGKKLLLLSIPTILEQILLTLLQYVDTAMVGHLGKEATAAVSVTTTINWLLGSMSSAIGIAAIAMISKSIGEKDKEKTKSVSMQILILTLAIGLFTEFTACIISPYIPAWMGAESKIRKDASNYFLIISLALVFRSATSILGSAIRATKDTKTPLYINIFANTLNIALNYLLIYVLDYKVVGAAIASAISFTISGILMFIFYKKNSYLNYTTKEFKIDAGILRKCIQISLPVLATSITSCMGYIVFAALVSGLGTTVFAAHSLAVTAEQLFYIPGYGLRTATSTMIGNSLGERDEKKFKNVCHASVLFTICMMIVTGLALFFVSLPLMSLFTSNNEVARLGAKMLRLVAFSEPFFGLMIVMEGILYGLGKTKPPFYVETIGMWMIRILFTFLCVNIWGLGLTSVWICMIADNIFKAIGLVFVSKRYVNKTVDTY